MKNTHVSSNTPRCNWQWPSSRGGAHTPGRAARRCVPGCRACGAPRCVRSAVGPRPGDPPWRPGAAAGSPGRPRGPRWPRAAAARARCARTLRARRRGSRWDRGPGRARRGVPPPQGEPQRRWCSPTSPPARRKRGGGWVCGLQACRGLTHRTWLSCYAPLDSQIALGDYIDLAY